MAQSSGFFDALKTGNTYDRTYTASDYSNNMGAIVSTGIYRSGDNDLRVTISSGMGLNVNIGRAWINGKWYYNDTIYDDFTVPTAPTGDRPRIDRVVLRLDENQTGRQIILAYLTGTVSDAPTAPALTRTGGIYELALADIYVSPNVTSILQTDITDQRGNKDVCGWITTPVGYDDYFTAMDDEFNDWLDEKKETLAVSTLFKRYHDRIVTDTETNLISFNIPQYDPSGVDILDVYVNGILEIETTDYTATQNSITFVNSKIAGTEIDVFVYKSIDGEGLGSVSDEVTELQNEMNQIKNIGDYIYKCNGTNDNVKLSEIAQDFLGSDTNYDQMIIKVYGTFGASAPYAGSGTSVNRYRWFSFGLSAITNRKIVFDFEGCSQVTLNCTAGNHYIGFYGTGVNIKNASVIANCAFSDASFSMFSATTGFVNAENCRFWVNANTSSIISQTGTFMNCKAYVTNTAGNSYCFNISPNGLLRIVGGEYYAYTGSNTYNAAAIYIDETASTAVAITQGMNCPTVAKTSHYQKNAVLCNAGLGGFTDTISNLTIKAASTQNVRGIIAASKPERG